MRILIIDDDIDLCMLTKKVLSKSGYEAEAFDNAKLGIQHARENIPNLILMDIMMPGLSGPEIVSLLKAEPQFRDVPVIFLTGLVTGGDRGLEEEGIMVGGLMYKTLGKPYEIDRLLAVVKRYAK